VKPGNNVWACRAMTGVASLLCLLASVIAAHSAEPSDLLGHWPFNEGAGHVARDIVGGNDLELIGNPVWVRNPGGYCLLFDGSDQRRVYGRLSGHRGYRGQVDQGTISVWARAVDGGVALSGDTAGRARVLSLGFPAETILGIRNGRWCGLVYDGRTVVYIDGPTVSDGEWTHLAATWDDFFTRFYVNGREIREGGPYLRTPVVGSGITSWTRSHVASHVPRWGQMFKGYVDEWKFYNRALCPEEIAAAYAREKEDRALTATVETRHSGDAGGGEERK
jgi:hypothetical protein